MNIVLSLILMGHMTIHCPMMQSSCFLVTRHTFEKLHGQNNKKSMKQIPS